MPFSGPTSEHKSDESLMIAVARRDDRAFAALYDRYSPRMYRFFLRMLGKDTAKAQDFTQELFLKIIEKATLFDPNRSFRTWLYTVAYNLCKNEYRRVQPLDLASAPERYWEENWPEKMDRPLYEQLLRDCIDRLPAPQRQCFILRYQEELSVAEIADIVECPEGTVKSRLHHALRQVAADMGVWKNMYKNQ